MGLCSVDKYFHLQLWDRLFTSGNNHSKPYQEINNPSPHLSLYSHGEFDFNYTPIDPPGKRVIMHNGPNDRASWEPHG